MARTPAERRKAEANRTEPDQGPTGYSSSAFALGCGAQTRASVLTSCVNFGNCFIYLGLFSLSEKWK